MNSESDSLTEWLFWHPDDLMREMLEQGMTCGEALRHLETNPVLVPRRPPGVPHIRNEKPDSWTEDDLNDGIYCGEGAYRELNMEWRSRVECFINSHIPADRDFRGVGPGVLVDRRLPDKLREYTMPHYLGPIEVPPGSHVNARIQRRGLPGTDWEILRLGAPVWMEFTSNQSMCVDAQHELKRQLQEQEYALSTLSVADVVGNINRYNAKNRSDGADRSRIRRRERDVWAFRFLCMAIQDGDGQRSSVAAARSEADALLKKHPVAATHALDAVAGGSAALYSGIGGYKANSSIGSQWAHRYMGQKRVDILASSLNRWWEVFALDDDWKPYVLAHVHFKLDGMPVWD